MDDITLAQARTLVTPAQVELMKQNMMALDFEAAGDGRFRSHLNDDQFRAAQVILWGETYGNGHSLEMHGRADELETHFGRRPTYWEFTNQMRGGGPLPFLEKLKDPPGCGAKDKPCNWTGGAVVGVKPGALFRRGTTWYTMPGGEAPPAPTTTPGEPAAPPAPPIAPPPEPPAAPPARPVIPVKVADEIERLKKMQNPAARRSVIDNTIWPWLLTIADKSAPK